MKSFTKQLYLLSALLFSVGMFAQTLSQEDFLVKGECSMCKDRIEATAKKSGAKTAVWNAGTQTLSVSYDQGKTSAEKILKDIAAVGHDNEMFTASDEVYNNLPGCCLYAREPSFLKTKTESTGEATVKKDYFVKGNCTMCEERIETAAKSMGATNVVWNAPSQKLSFDFDESTTSVEKILQKIADVGHDN